MKRLFLPLAFATALAFPAFAQTSLPQSPHVSVTGEGEFAVSPDMAILALTVMREAVTAREALDANNAAMERVIAAMKEAGIAERDMQTAGFSITPRYVYPQEGQEPQEPKIQAYQVMNTLTVRVRDLSKVGEILDRSVTLGVNQGGQVVFTNDDPSAALAEARKRAVQDAMNKARTLSEAAGVNLGNVLEISEQNFMPPPIPYQGKAMRMEAAAQDASVPIETGENTYRVQVNMSFELNQ
jgi:uncharacterized protein YggE